MVTTFQALVVVALAVLPGAIYVWAFERQVGAWGAGLSDRLLRFLGASAAFLILALPVLYELYRRHVTTGRVQAGEAMPWWLWLLPAVFFIVPMAAGDLIGRATKRRQPWVKLLTGPAPAPRAWDHLFTTPNLGGYVRLKLVDGTWVFGLWGEQDDQARRLPHSYASGYPAAQELYFLDTAEIDDQGRYTRDSDGKPVLRGMALLLRWDQVTYLEFIEG